MSFYRFADRVFEIKTKYGYTHRLCADYAVSNEKPDYFVETSEEEIAAENTGESAITAPGYLESLAVYRKISECLAEEDCFLFHAAVIEYDGTAYAFTAKSGTGKTTHISLWEKAFGDKVRIINGDKPLVRRVKRSGGDGYEFLVYGTPWCGKERKHINDKAVLGGIFLLERSEENFARHADDKAVPFLIQQLHVKREPKYLASLLSFADSLVKEVPIYNLGVNMDISAAYAARDAALNK